jgi:methionyl-tRNA synthetase
VWFDALGNYITALDYANKGPDYAEWWQHSQERVHVIGKGIIRFHAVYWPAMLLSAGEPLPTTIFVHDYLSVEGQKLAKSLGNAIDPNDIVERYSSDALRWWFLRDVPRNGDADFKETALVARANELADSLGNLINRTISMLLRYRAPDHGPSTLHLREAEPLTTACVALPAAIDTALAVFDLRGATEALWLVVTEANRFITVTEPWNLGKDAQSGNVYSAQKLGAVLAVLQDTATLLASELVPFLPEAAGRITQALEHLDLELGRALFPKF